MPFDDPANVLTDERIPVDDRAALAGLLVGAYLTGVTRGREDLTGEQNEERQPPVYAFGRWYDQAGERRAHDAATAGPGGYEGGPVDVW